MTVRPMQKGWGGLRDGPLAPLQPLHRKEAAVQPHANQ
jgi:hypothetical protein